MSLNAAPCIQHLVVPVTSPQEQQALCLLLADTASHPQSINPTSAAVADAAEKHPASSPLKSIHLNPSQTRPPYYPPYTPRKLELLNRLARSLGNPPRRGEHALDELARRRLEGVAVDVEPGAAEDEFQVLGQVEDGRDEGEGEEQEEDRVCFEVGG